MGSLLPKLVPFPVRFEAFCLLTLVKEQENKEISKEKHQSLKKFEEIPNFANLPP